jgi:hypothetical protein
VLAGTVNATAFQGKYHLAPGARKVANIEWLLIQIAATQHVQNSVWITRRKVLWPLISSTRMYGMNNRK